MINFESQCFFGASVHGGDVGMGSGSDELESVSVSDVRQISPPRLFLFPSLLKVVRVAFGVGTE